MKCKNCINFKADVNGTFSMGECLEFECPIEDAYRDADKCNEGDFYVKVEIFEA